MVNGVNLVFDFVSPIEEVDKATLAWNERLHILLTLHSYVILKTSFELMTSSHIDIEQSEWVHVKMKCINWSHIDISCG
jgi:hypothetical protein